MPKRINNEPIYANCHLGINGPINIAVFSDSHGYDDRLAVAIDDATQQCDIHLAIHLGDHFSDMKVIHQKRPGWPTFGVRGNNDYDTPEAPDEALLEVGLIKIYCTHGHIYGIDRILYRAEELGANVALFGHTHRVMVDQSSSISIMNPGSVALPRDGKGRAYGILRLEGRSVNCSTMSVR